MFWQNHISSSLNECLHVVLGLEQWLRPFKQHTALELLILSEFLTELLIHARAFKITEGKNNPTLSSCHCLRLSETSTFSS